MTDSTTRYAISCCGCGQILQIRYEVLGRKARCPNCQTVFRAPLEAPQVSAALAGQTDQQTAPQQLLATHVGGQQGHSPGSVVAPAVPSGTKRCERCHQYVALGQFDAHFRQHTGKQDDGQLNTYPTLPPERRWRGDLATVPQFYEHRTCGSVTGMPEEIIRTYLVNPYFYANRSYCGGCERHVYQRELTWITTGENVNDYFDRLKKSVPHAKFYRRKAIKTVVAVGTLFGIVLGGIAGLIGFLFFEWILALILFVAVTLVATPLCSLMLFRIRGGL